MTVDIFNSILSGKPNPNFLRAIGKVTTEFGKLESELAGFIVILINNDDPDIGSIITSELSFKQLVQMSMSLYRYRISSKSKVEQLRKVLGKCIELETERNNTIHSHWSSYERWTFVERRKFTAKLKKGLQKERKTVLISELDQLADDIHSLSLEVSKVSYELFKSQKIST